MGIDNRSSSVGHFNVVNNQLEHVGNVIVADGHRTRAFVLAQVNSIGNHFSGGDDIVTSRIPRTVLQHIAVVVAIPVQSGRSKGNVSFCKAARLEATRAVHGIGGLDAVVMSATIVATSLLGDDFTSRIVNHPTVFSTIFACGIDKVNHSAGAKRKLVGSGAATFNGISAIDFASGGIHHFHLAAIPAVTIGVGEGKGDGTHIAGPAGRSGEGVSITPIAGFATVAVGLYLHSIGS